MQLSLVILDDLQLAKPVTHARLKVERATSYVVGEAAE